MFSLSRPCNKKNRYWFSTKTQCAWLDEVVLWVVNTGNESTDNFREIKKVETSSRVTVTHDKNHYRNQVWDGFGPLLPKKGGGERVQEEGSLSNHAWALALRFSRHALFGDHPTKPRVWFSGQRNILVYCVAFVHCFEIVNLRSLMISEYLSLIFKMLKYLILSSVKLSTHGVISNFLEIKCLWLGVEYYSRIKWTALYISSKNYAMLIRKADDKRLNCI